MAMELFVVLALETLPNTSQMNELAEKVSIPIVYEAGIELRDIKGYLPAKVAGRKSGLEIHTSAYDTASIKLSSFDAQQYQQPVLVTLRWGGDFSEMTSALSTAYLLSEGYSATTFEPQKNTYLSTAELKTSVFSMLDTAK
ncbi:hypothetical protein ACOQ0N_004714 [Vibrio parahaemolyticus]|uniref:hypothetical protein n=1 Tax=Vibrio parahaemolyticus TaxID=670 RepID=UPI0004169C3A|nr:hypothetical protein [Vibrio parahaemolyticus]AMG07133.1 hypothetical protein AL464_10210 [Vibrio parahaemolyticus]EGR0429415.1 hypothetical protein [Vibrio parahaemolyticus]EID4334194.1 hypothetical protein [Vibrio parahaemolyticus]KKI07076.1 hypothetical protein WU75_22840 [Vibrio parahaemolyticus]MBY7693962.1 hypothetical protein [Vibrio parahaemolyticus]